MDDRIYEEMKEHLPSIFVNFQAGGPNQKRKDLASTHQSLPESIETHFRLCKNQEISRFSEDVIKLKTIIIHHNAFELGVDSFNDNLRIRNAMLEYLESNHLDNPYLKVAKEVLENFKQLPLSQELVREVLNKQILFPKIGEQIVL